MKLEGEKHISEPPKYLNEDFFKAALEDGLRDMRVDIKKIIFAESNSGGGENYCSKIYRARALYRSSKRQLDEELALIVKSIAITPATQFLEELAVYLREKIFYFDVLGKLEVLIGDGSKFGAKCFYTTREPIQTIVFDDLTQYGYKLANRQSGLNEEHCVVILKKLGKFHASSMVLVEKVSQQSDAVIFSHQPDSFGYLSPQEPSVREHFSSGMLDENYIRTNERFINFMTLQLRTLANLVAKWTGYEKLAEKLHRHCDNIKENLVLTGRAVPGEITVLNHGDLWVNNFMYKYHDELPTKPIDAIFVSCPVRETASDFTNPNELLLLGGLSEQFLWQSRLRHQLLSQQQRPAGRAHAQARVPHTDVLRLAAREPGEHAFRVCAQLCGHPARDQCQGAVRLLLVLCLPADGHHAQGGLL